LLLSIYAIFGSLYLFPPPIKDLAMAFYFSVVTIEGRLRMGNPIP
jgi:hypothetical protein